MNEFRKEAKEVLSETSWLSWRVLWVALPILAVVIVFFFAMSSFGYFGRIFVERKVFENSYQRSESIKSRIAKEEAVLAEIEQQLSNPNLDDNTKFNLKAQARAARVRINTAKGLK